MRIFISLFFYCTSLSIPLVSNTKKEGKDRKNKIEHNKRQCAAPWWSANNSVSCWFKGPGFESACLSKSTHREMFIHPPCCVVRGGPDSFPLNFIQKQKELNHHPKLIVSSHLRQGSLWPTERWSSAFLLLQVQHKVIDEPLAPGAMKHLLYLSINNIACINPAIGGICLFFLSSHAWHEQRRGNAAGGR